MNDPIRDAIRAAFEAEQESSPPPPGLRRRVVHRPCEEGTASSGRTLLAGVASLVLVTLVVSALLVPHLLARHQSAVPGPAPTPVPFKAPSPVPSLTPAAIVGASWIDRRQGWALVSPGNCPSPTGETVLATTDGGSTWIQVGTLTALASPSPSPENCAAGAPRPPAPATGLLFASSLIGYAFGQNGFFMTSDGGRTWMAQPGPLVASLAVSGNVAFRLSYDHTGCPGPCDVEVQSAPVGSNSWRLLASLPNGSGGWTQILSEGPNVYVARYGNLAAGAGTQQAVFLISNDGGATWARRSDACGFNSSQNLQDANDAVAMADAPGGTLAVLCKHRSGSGPFVVVSTNGGVTFGAREAAPPDVDLVTLTSPSKVFVASGGVSGAGTYTHRLYSSLDGGQRWQEVITDPEPVLGVVAQGTLGFSTNEDGYWLASTGTIWTTADGGARWTSHRVAG